MSDAIAENIKHFDAKHAHEYDNDQAVQLAKEISRNILKFKHKELQALEKPSETNQDPSSTSSGGDDDDDDEEDEDNIEVNPFWKGTKVLDFACGTGLVSQVSHN